MRFFIIFVILLLNYSPWNNVWADVEIQPDNTTIDSFTLNYLYDETRQYTINEISRKDFPLQINNRFTQGYLEGNSWFKLTVHNNSQNQHFVLYLSEPFWDQFDLYYKKEQLWLSHKNGLSIPLNQRDYNDTHPAFKLTIAPGDSQTYYLMGSSVSAHIGKLLLYTEKEYLRPTRITLNDLYLFYQGILLIIIILNSFLFIAVRERIYAWYIAYVLAFSAFISVLSGSYLILGLPPWSDALHTIGTIVVMFMTLFSGAFLELRERLPKMQRVFNAFALVFALFAVLIALKVPYSSLVFNIVSSIFFTLLLFVSIKVWLQGYLKAQYYLIALIIYMPSMALMTLTFNGLIENTELSRYSFIAGSFTEIIFFSLLLVNRFYDLQQEKIKIQAQLIEEQEKTEHYLEQEIQKRSRELIKTNQRLSIQTSELEKAKKELTLQAITDPLTQLYNRRYFADIASKAFFNAVRYEQALAIIMLDIDEFKKINDVYGHHTGDQVIARCARLLTEFSRKSDTVARYGGEEFIILVPQTSLSEVQSLAQRIKQEVNNICIVLKDDSVVTFSISIGIAQIEKNQDHNIQDIIQRADQALYKAKQQGRDQIVTIV